MQYRGFSHQLKAESTKKIEDLTIESNLTSIDVVVIYSHELTQFQPD